MGLKNCQERRATVCGCQPRARCSLIGYEQLVLVPSRGRNLSLFFEGCRNGAVECAAVGTTEIRFRRPTFSEPVDCSFLVNSC